MTSYYIILLNARPFLRLLVTAGGMVSKARPLPTANNINFQLALLTMTACYSAFLRAGITNNKMAKEILKELIPAIPPKDYKGSVGMWIAKLQVKGLWDGKRPDWHGDVMITQEQWCELLEECEG